MSDTDFVTIRLWQGRLSLGAAPDKNDLSALLRAKFTHLGCCLASHEVDTGLQHNAQQAGLHWTWLPFTVSTLSEASDMHYLRQYLSSLRKLLQRRSQVYIFCDESQTRCVLLVYALCLNAGMSASAAYSAIWELAGINAHQIPRTQLRAVAQMDAYR